MTNLEAQHIANLINWEIEQERESFPTAQKVIDTCDNWHTQKIKKEVS